MSAYTSGPWLLDGRYILGAEITDEDGDRVRLHIAVAALNADGSGDAEQKANALLIAAAPELLSALKLAREFVALDVRSLLESHCILDPVTLEPDRSTIDDMARLAFEEAESALAQIDVAIAKAEGAA